MWFGAFTVVAFSWKDAFAASQKTLASNATMKDLSIDGTWTKTAVAAAVQDVLKNEASGWSPTAATAAS